MLGFAPISSEPIAALYNEPSPPAPGDSIPGMVLLMGVG